MEIYCSRRQYDNVLDRFVGKDIWIYTDLMCSNPRAGRYIRIVGKTKNLYIINSAAKRNVERIVKTQDILTYENAITCTFKFTIEEVVRSVQRPLLVYTTEELFEGLDYENLLQ